MAKRHHSSRRRAHHLSHAESERMLADRYGHHGHDHHEAHHHSSKRARHHEHMGMEEYERGPVRNHSAAHHSSSKESHGGYMDPEHYHAERRGLERAGYRHAMLSGHEYYAGMEPRRRQEMEDAGMIHEDHREIANLPQQVMIKPYPMTGPYLPEVLDDTIAGIDRQMDYDDGKRRMSFYPKKV